jgi:Flp pilus assembly protein TadG
VTAPSLLHLRRVLLRVVKRHAAGPSPTSRERGSAVVEFVFLAVLMMIPLIYLVMMLGRLQAGAYAAVAAAREAGRAYVTAQSEEAAGARAEAAARIAFEDQGFGDNGRVRLQCDGTPCLRPEGRIEVTTEVTVPLPLVPSFARAVIPLEVPLTAAHVAVVDRFRGQP